MTIVDEGYESGEDAISFAKEVDALLEQPIEDIIHKTRRELGRIKDPSIRQAYQSQLKTLLVHRAAIQEYSAPSELERCWSSRAPQSTEDVEDAKIRATIDGIVQDCNHAINTSKALLVLEMTKQMEDIRDRTERTVFLMNMATLSLPFSFLASFLGLFLPPSASMIAFGAAVMALSFFLIIFGIERKMECVRRISSGVIEHLRYRMAPWKARKLQDLEHGGDGHFQQAREERDPEKQSLAMVAVRYTDMKTSRGNVRNVGYVGQGNNHAAASHGQMSTSCSQQSVPHQPSTASKELLNSKCKNNDRTSCQSLKRKRQDLYPDEGRFPCIYFVGDESGCFASHTKRHAFISQLLRHLRTHDFFACPKCFTRFSTEAEEQDHQLTPCVKACRNRRCKRHCTNTASVRPAGCDPCITTPEMQWSELFKLEYPDKEIPADLFSFKQIAHRRSFSDISSEFVVDENQIDFDNAESQPTLAGADTDQADHVGWGTMPFLFEDSENFTLNHDQTNNQEPEPDLASAFELFPMASTRSDREQDLEAALSLVWDALRRSGSSEGLPGSSAHRVLQRLAPELLI